MLNYSALSDPLTPQDIAAYRQLQPGMSVALKIFFIVFVSIFGTFLFGSLLIAAILAGSPAVVVGLFFIMFAIGGGVVLIWLSTRKQTLSTARLYKFAVQNGAAFTVMRLDPPESGIIFGEGHSRLAYSSIDFQGGFHVSSYRYVTGSGKNTQTHVWSYARLPLERHVPNMMIDAKSNNLFRRFSNLPAGYKKAQIQKIQPEFDALYTLYVPENYELDAYYLLTPDVLAALVDARGYYDIEVVDNIIYFYAQSRIDFSKKESWDQLLRVVAPVAKELREQADYYADAKADAPRSADVVAPEGRRLRRGITIPSIIASILFVLYFIFVIISGTQ